MKRTKITYLCTVVLWMFSCGVRGWTAPDFCRGYECPEFKVVQKTKDFEERTYSASRWITTGIASATEEDLKVGFTSLYQYCTGQNNGSTGVTTKTWPATVTITEVEGGKDVSVSFFIPPGTVLPAPSDPSIREETISARNVYVRIYSSFMSSSAAQANVKQLREALKQAGKAFEPHRYTAAGYQNPWVIFNQHNEVWVDDA